MQVDIWKSGSQFYKDYTDRRKGEAAVSGDARTKDPNSYANSGETRNRVSDPWI